MEKLELWELTIVLSCLIMILITLTLSTLPKGPVTEAWLSDYPTSLDSGQNVSFKLHLNGWSDYEVTAFVDDEKQATVRSNDHYTLSFMLPNPGEGVHRITAKINDLNSGDSHYLFFTVDVL